VDADVAVVVDLDVIVNGVNPVLAAESSRERKKFRVSGAKRIKAIVLTSPKSRLSSFC
jgi:hypothetical protein